MAPYAPHGRKKTSRNKRSFSQVISGLSCFGGRATVLPGRKMEPIEEDTGVHQPHEVNSHRRRGMERERSATHYTKTDSGFGGSKPSTHPQPQQPHPIAKKPRPSSWWTYHNGSRISIFSAPVKQLDETTTRTHKLNKSKSTPRLSSQSNAAESAISAILCPANIDLDADYHAFLRESYLPSVPGSKVQKLPPRPPSDHFYKLPRASISKPEILNHSNLSFIVDILPLPPWHSPISPGRQVPRHQAQTSVSSSVSSTVSSSVSSSISNSTSTTTNSTIKRPSPASTSTSTSTTTLEFSSLPRPIPLSRPPLVSNSSSASSLQTIDSLSTSSHITQANYSLPPPIPPRDHRRSLRPGSYPHAVFLHNPPTNPFRLSGTPTVSHPSPCPQEIESPISPSISSSSSGFALPYSSIVGRGLPVSGPGLGTAKGGYSGTGMGYTMAWSGRPPSPTDSVAPPPIARFKSDDVGPRTGGGGLWSLSKKLWKGKGGERSVNWKRGPAEMGCT